MGCPIEAFIKDSLVEILLLKVKRDQIKAPAKSLSAYLLQCEIFRKFSTIDVLLSSSSLLSSVFKAEELKSLVAAVKKETESGDDVFKKARVRYLPSLKKDREDDSPPFPFMDFPIELREKILKKITDSTDKLNIIEAIPGAGQLMGWNPSFLKFDLAFPILLEYHFNMSDILRPEVLMNLSMASDHFYDLIRNFFDRTPRSHQREYSFPAFQPQIVDVHDILQKPDFQDMKPMLPFPIWLDLTGFGGGRPSLANENSRRTLSALNGIGHRTRDCDIVVNGTSLQILQNIRFAFLKMPNLERVSINYIVTSDPDSLRRPNGIRIELPEMPNLKSLTISELYELGGPLNGAILEQLRRSLGKYLFGLSVLEIRDFFHFPDHFPPKRLPHLSTLTVIKELGNFENFVERLSSFAGSPLKVIRLTGDWGASISPQSFPLLMTTLSSHFGRTLEHLLIDQINEKIWFGAGSDSEWIVDLNFPKLKVLRLKKFRGSWSFLHRFPVLEELYVDLSYQDFRGSVFSSSDSKKKFVEQSILKSDIWKLMPFLNSISAEAGQASGSNYTIYFGEVSRARTDCIGSSSTADSSVFAFSFTDWFSQMFYQSSSSSILKI